MPADFRNIIKKCEICGSILKLNNTRDIKRKRFCSRVCIGISAVSQGLLTNDYSAITREKMRQSKLDLLKIGWQPIGWRKYLPHKRLAGRGYIFVGQKREHQIVMENKLGRHLRRNEIVHHIDDNKANNDIMNLQLMTRSEHIRHHCKQRRLQNVTPGF